MGFHGVHCFNLTMLAKQDRLFLRIPTLYVPVLGAKYFSDGDFVNVKLKKDPLLRGQVL